MTAPRGPANRSLPQELRGRLRPLRLLAAAYLDAVRSGHRLPPGPLTNLQRREFRDQHHLLRRARRHGEVFKAIQDGGLIICVTGLPRARRLIASHEDRLRPASVPLTMPFPRGLLRVMEGDDHRRYRQALNAALHAVDPAPGYQAVDGLVAAELHSYVCAHENGAGDHAQLTSLLRRIASASLIRLFFGAAPGTAEGDELMSLYGRLGPDGYQMHMDPEQAAAFEQLRRVLHARGARVPASAPPDRPDNVLDRMARAGNLDETALGNLIYMVEIGRYDLYSLFRWMLKRAADAPRVMEQMVDAQPGDRPALGTAFVLEALRLSQSERLIRRVKQRFVFDGYCFPKDAWVRICLWEAHKASEVFAEPFAFRPERFIDRRFDPDAFAPFGLGRHRCPMAEPNVVLGARFIATLADGYSVHPVVDEPPHRGRHHWEPGPHFTVRLEPRERRPGRTA